MKKDLEQRMQSLLDKQEIYELTCRYARALDRLDKELLRSLYHEDATDNRGFFAGSRDEFVEMAISMAGACVATQHLVGQANIDIEDDIAFGEVYFQSFHRVVDEDGAEQDFVLLGRYVDRYEKRDDVWKIAHRSMLKDFDRTDPAAEVWGKSTPEALRAARGADDLSSQREALRER